MLDVLSGMYGPDIAQAVSILTQVNSCYSLEHCDTAKSVLRYLKGSEDYALVYSKSDKFVEGFVDADVSGNIDNRRSFSGFVFKLTNGPISWVRRNQRTVTLSSAESEYVNLSEGFRESTFLSRIMK
jgi:hypothetical protein